MFRYVHTNIIAKDASKLKRAVHNGMYSSLLFRLFKLIPHIMLYWQL